MTYVIKISLILLFLISGCTSTKKISIDPSLSPYEKRLNEIKRATVVLSHKTPRNADGSKGTGTLFNTPFTGSFILTNAHVCLEDMASLIHDEDYKKDWLKRTSLYKITGQYDTKRTRVKNNEISYIFKTDFCIIPVNKEDFPESFHFLNEESSIDVLNQVEEEKHPNKIYLITRNHAEDEEVLIKSGTEELKWKYVIMEMKTKSAYKNKEVKTYEIEKGPVSYTSINIVPGDSGSLIYDKYLNVHGLAFGNSVQDPEIVGLKLKEDESYFEKFIEFFGVSAKDLGQQKLELKDLKGMFIRKDFFREGGVHDK